MLIISSRVYFDGSANFSSFRKRVHGCIFHISDISLPSASQKYMFICNSVWALLAKVLGVFVFTSQYISSLLNRIIKNNYNQYS